MPAQYVKPYVKTNKSEYTDAEAIAEAVGRPKMRFVPIKTDDQLDMQSLHRVRERWVMRRTAVINQIRRRSLTLRNVAIRRLSLLSPFADIGRMSSFADIGNRGDKCVFVHR